MATTIQIATGDKAVRVTLQDGTSILVDPNSEKSVELAEGGSAAIVERKEEDAGAIETGDMKVEIKGKVGGVEEGTDSLR